MFIDYILRSDVMKEIILNYPYINVNMETDKILDSSYLDNKGANVPDYIIDNGFFVENIADSIKLYDKVWAEIK